MSTRRCSDGRDAPTVLTPHDREFARIADGPSADRLASARAAAAKLGVTMLLKGRRDDRRRTRRPCVDQPHRHPVARHGRQRGRPVRADRLAARGRTRGAGGRGGRRLRARCRRPARGRRRSTVLDRCAARGAPGPEPDPPRLKQFPGQDHESAVPRRVLDDIIRIREDHYGIRGVRPQANTRSGQVHHRAVRRSSPGRRSRAGRDAAPLPALAGDRRPRRSRGLRPPLPGERVLQLAAQVGPAGAARHGAGRTVFPSPTAPGKWPIGRSW